MKVMVRFTKDPVLRSLQREKLWRAARTLVFGAAGILMVLGIVLATTHTR